MRGKFKIVLVVLSLCFVSTILNLKSEAFAKPISNVIKASITVDGGDDVTVGDDSIGEDDGDKNYTISINKAIKDAKQGTKIKIKSGEYIIDYIENKDVTLESHDGGYVDIFVKEAFPKDTKLKVSDKVTINQKGVSPIKISAEIINIGSPNKPNIPIDDIQVINVDKEDNVCIKLRKEIINKLGFNNANLMLKIDKNKGVSVKSAMNGYAKDVPLGEDLIYNIGELPNEVESVIISIRFDEGGQYNIEVWVEDKR